MKILRKIKEEKGSITMTVVAAMLFITSSILIAYFSLSNQSNDQSKKIRQVADSYKVTNKNNYTNGRIRPVYSSGSLIYDSKQRHNRTGKSSIENIF